MVNDFCKFLDHNMIFNNILRFFLHQVNSSKQTPLTLIDLSENVYPEKLYSNPLLIFFKFLFFRPFRQIFFFRFSTHFFIYVFVYSRHPSPSHVYQFQQNVHHTSYYPPTHTHTLHSDVVQCSRVLQVYPQVFCIRQDFKESMIIIPVG